MQDAIRKVSKAPAPFPAQDRDGKRAAMRAFANDEGADQHPVLEGAEASKDRRKGTRREPKFDRSVNSPPVAGLDEQWFPRKWTYLILACIMTIAVCTIASTTLPRPGTWLVLAFAVLFTLPIARVHDFVMPRSNLAKAIGLVAVVVLPLFMMGFGLTVWASNEGIRWDVAMAGILCVSCIATAYLRRQPGAIFAAQFAIWSAAVMVHASLAGILGLFVGLTVAVLVTREQLLEQKSEYERLETQERVQTRARDILSDYEETGQGWFWETDRRSLLTYISPPVAKALRRNPDRLIGQSFTRLFDLEDTGDEGERTLIFHLSARSAFSELPVRAAIEKEERWWSVSGRPIYDQFDNFVGFRGSGTDLTERKRSQEQATRLARYDALTGLANRFQMSQSLEKILGAQSEANRHCAILLLDLDRFKQVNDTMGHPAGDALLKQVSQRLERAVGKLGQVGRLGGDEFKVIIPSRVERNVLANLSKEIIHSISQPYSIDGQRVVIGLSIGIAVSPEHGDNSEELIRNADLALYAAKDGGRGRYHFYAEDLHAEAEARSQLEEDLRDAVVKGEMELHYQPIVSMATDRISGFEALLRWNHPVKGWISPTRFIGIAEDSGIINSLGEWALRQACKDLALWPDEVCVAVNVSPIQFSNVDFPNIVKNAIAHADVRASRLELEITESIFLGDDHGNDEMFAALKRIGVRLALDDFGTGYSSLGYLKKAPFDKIKIDQSFVRGMTEKGSRNGAIITSITSLAQSLGMDTTAEGVETHDELELIRRHGCSHVQGYIFDRSQPLEQVLERLAGGLGTVAEGPKSSRATRQKMLRKVVLDHDGHLYNGTIRNISVTGAMVEGLWNVPVGTTFHVHISTSQVVSCIARWSVQDRMGVEFANPLQRDGTGQITAIQGPPPKQIVAGEMRKAG
ncbi:EAL domain-containing protein [Aurantiacibacter marinus]|uniref:Diguanylate cyclase n=1 Tax=Aurantiacibacter marinus TaxID=874156 RepID=A0A0H0XM45_9SPHN|nr:EAL domain-containing protein [Aurantiacibacter marinus]KLI63683.1 diguanylate cyclase [Aurantiacibacter marinus]